MRLNEGAVDPWTKPNYDWYQITGFARSARGKVRINVPFADLTPAEFKIVKEAVNDFFAQVETKKYKVHVRVFLSRYRGYTDCPECRRRGVREEARNVFRGRTARSADVARMNIAEALEFFNGLVLVGEEEAIAGKVLVEIRQRLSFLHDVGLDYLDARPPLSMTLSGGEAQRIQLATCLGSRLVGATYVLDEPSIGLHSRDTGRLIRILKELRDLGNTILVVEHDADVMRAADHIVDMGPGAGENGGRVVFEGDLQALLDSSAGRRRRLSRPRAICAASWKTLPRPDRRKPDKKRQIRFLGCRANNLKNIDVAVPLGSDDGRNRRFGLRQIHRWFTM